MCTHCYYVMAKSRVIKIVHAQLVRTNSHKLDARMNFMIYGTCNTMENTCYIALTMLDILPSLECFTQTCGSLSLTLLFFSLKSNFLCLCFLAAALACVGGCFSHRQLTVSAEGSNTDLKDIQISRSNDFRSHFLTFDFWAHYRHCLLNALHFWFCRWFCWISLHTRFHKWFLISELITDYNMRYWFIIDHKVLTMHYKWFYNGLGQQAGIPRCLRRRLILCFWFQLLISWKVYEISTVLDPSVSAALTVDWAPNGHVADLHMAFWNDMMSRWVKLHTKVWQAYVTGHSARFNASC